MEREEEMQRLLSCIMDIGESLLESGAEVSRVEDTICRLGRAYGAERVDVFTITTSIVVTLQGAGLPALTQTRRIRGMKYNLHRLEQVNQLSRQICARPMTAEQIKERLQTICAEPEYSFRDLALIYALISASFSVFFGGSAADALASAAIGILLKGMSDALKKAEINSFLAAFFCSVLGGFLAIWLVGLGLGDSADKISIGNIMLLIPGIAMTNGIRDMFSGDMISGLLRFSEALLLAVTIAFGFVLASLLL